MDFFLDTNIVLHFIRNSTLADELKETFQLFKFPNRLFISIVSLGELESLALQKDWGIHKLKELENYSRQLIIADIRDENIVKRYAQIDAYSQGKLKNRSLNNSARNMSKNDLWIAATASVLNIPLLTTDADFEHLNKEFLTLIKIH